MLLKAEVFRTAFIGLLEGGPLSKEEQQFSACPGWSAGRVGLSGNGYLRRSCPAGEGSLVMTRGDVVILEVFFSDRQGSKVRPARRAERFPE